MGALGTLRRGVVSAIALGLRSDYWCFVLTCGGDCGGGGSTAVNVGC